MIVVFSLMRRREDVPREEFFRHWLDPHGPLVCKFPRLRYYVQNHIIEAPASALHESLHTDGFAELGYDNDGDQETATNSPEMAACDRDSPLFIGGVLRVVTEAREVKPRPSATAMTNKMIAVFAADDDTRRAMFAAEVMRTDGVVGYVENLPLRQRGPRSAMPVLDVAVTAIAEIWYSDNVPTQRVVASLQSSAGEQAACYTVREHRFI